MNFAIYTFCHEYFEIEKKKYCCKFLSMIIHILEFKVYINIL